MSVRTVAERAGVAVARCAHVFPTRSELVRFSAELYYAARNWSACLPPPPATSRTSTLWRSSKTSSHSTRTDEPSIRSISHSWLSAQRCQACSR